MTAAIAAAYYARRAAVASENTVQLARDASGDTARALVASEAGAAAAVASVSLSEEVAFLQNRPWLVFETNQNWHSENLKIGDETFARGIGFSTVWKNVGKTPAVKARLLTRAISTLIDADVPNVLFEPHEFGNQYAVIGPNSSAASATMGRGGKDYDDLINRKIKLFIFAEFRYNSLLKADREFSTKLCLEVSYNGQRDDDNGKTYPNFDFRPVGNFNGAT